MKLRAKVGFPEFCAAVLEYSCVYTQLHMDDRATEFCTVRVFSIKLYLQVSPGVDPELSAFETIIAPKFSSMYSCPVCALVHIVCKFIP